MSIVAVIPARYGSTRFPGKPLAKATGKYLVQPVFSALRWFFTRKHVREGYYVVCLSLPNRAVYIGAI